MAGWLAIASCNCNPLFLSHAYHALQGVVNNSSSGVLLRLQVVRQTEERQWSNGVQTKTSEMWPVFITMANTETCFRYITMANTRVKVHIALMALVTYISGLCRYRNPSILWGYTGGGVDDSSGFTQNESSSPGALAETSSKNWQLWWRRRMHCFVLTLYRAWWREWIKEF